MNFDDKTLAELRMRFWFALYGVEHPEEILKRFDQAVKETRKSLISDEPEDDGSRCPNCGSIVFTEYGDGEGECCADCGRLIND